MESDGSVIQKFQDEGGNFPLDISNAGYYYIDRFYAQSFTQYSQEEKDQIMESLVLSINDIAKEKDAIAFLILLSKLSSIIMHEHTPFSNRQYFYLMLCLVLRQLYVLMNEYKSCSPLVDLIYHFRDNCDCISLGSLVLLFFFINGNGNESDVKTLVQSNGIIALIGTFQYIIEADHIIEASTIEFLSLIYYLCQFGMFHPYFLY